VLRSGEHRDGDFVDWLVKEPEPLAGQRVRDPGCAPKRRSAPGEGAPKSAPTSASEHPMRPASGDRVFKEVAVLGHRAGKNAEVNLAVIFDRQHSYHGMRLPIACEQHCSWADSVRVCGVSECGPAETVVVLCVEVSCEIYVGHGGYLLRRLSLHDTG
jgi:hypothetical protein